MRQNAGAPLRALLSICFLALASSGCNCGGAGASALTLTVKFESSSAKCVVAGVQLEGTATTFHNDPAIARGSKSSLVFGVERTAAMKGKVTPFARGYDANDCSAVAFDSFDEVATGATVNLDKVGVQVVTLTLKGVGSSDGGADGGADAGDGGSGDAGCVWATSENCLDGVDNTCDGLVDCADPGCDTLACAGGGSCGFQTDGGRSCIQAVETLCGDNTDNDGDGKIDCADTDCAGQGCNDGNPCTHSDLCSGTSCVGSPYTCATSQCVSAANCAGDGGCLFTYAPVTAGCDDLAACTQGDHCDGVGICSGAGYSCASPPACFSGTACEGDGGCAWTFNGVGTACPGGSCGPDAGCVLTTSKFPYPTSNFDPASIPDASIAPLTVFSGCTVEFNTTNNTFADGGWCNQVKPVPMVFSQDGGISTTVLAMEGLTIAANANLVFYGSRPVILAIFGPADIQGVIDARSTGAGRVGPGGNFSGCGALNGQNATAASGGGGAGHGGAGAPGGGPGAGAGGAAGAGLTLRPLRGGCLGGMGHDSSNRTNAVGGAGGGALQLSCSATLTVGGTLSASGAGGQGGINGASDDNGGGGGGSGGAILLEAYLLQLGATARLTCNGGGGGGGRVNGSGIAGGDGDDGALATAAGALGGQRGTTPAGDGGTGAAGTTAAGAGIKGVGAAGSGGGGAGVGVIRLVGTAGCAIDGGALLSGALSKSALCP